MCRAIVYISLSFIGSSIDLINLIFIVTIGMHLWSGDQAFYFPTSLELDILNWSLAWCLFFLYI